MHADRAPLPAASTTATPPQRSTTTADPAAGFDLDGLLGAGKPGGPTISFVIDNVRESLTQRIAYAIDLAAPSRGTELEMEVKFHCPVEPPLFVAGGAKVTAARSATGGVTATLAGALGLSLGDGMGLFGDLLGGGSIQGEGKDAWRAAEMLSLALETAVRSLNDPTILTSLASTVTSNPMLSLVLLPAFGVACAGDVIADVLWGVGHAAAITAAMQEGDAAELTAGGTLGGSFETPEGEPEISVEGSLGVAGKHRIERAEGGAATTTDSAEFAMSGEIGVGPISGSAEVKVPLQRGAPPSGTLTLAGKGTIDAAMLGDFAKFGEYLVGGIAVVEHAFTKAPATAQETATAARSQLAMLKDSIRPVVTAAQGAVLRELEALGADVAVGLEAKLELKFGAAEASLQFAFVTELEATLPGGNTGAMNQKLLLGPNIPIPTKPGQRREGAR
jgi:hypothetical protein